MKIKNFIFLCFIYILNNLHAGQEAKVLVTGCGRSGTTYISKVFKEAGYEVDHERETGSFGTCSWYILFEEDRKRSYSVVLHQVRHPLLTIASMHTASSYSWNYICDRIPEINPQEPLLVKCAKYWLFWNLEAEARADLSYPIERIVEHLPQINLLTGAELLKKHLNSVSTRENHRNHLNLCWDDLEKNLSAFLYESILEYAKKWGYNIPIK